MDWEPLRPERLLLRAFRPGDAAAFAAYRSDPAAARYEGWDAPYPLERAERFVAEVAGAEPRRPREWRQVAIELLATGAVIGDAAFKPEAPDGRQAEVGLALAAAYQAQGHGAEAMRRLLAYLLADPHLHRVYASCDVDNAPAYRAVERLGFRREAWLTPVVKTTDEQE